MRILIGFKVKDIVQGERSTIDVVLKRLSGNLSALIRNVRNSMALKAL